MRLQGSSAKKGTCTGPSEVCLRTTGWSRGGFGGRKMSTTPRTPSPLWSMEVETLCFGSVSHFSSSKHSESSWCQIALFWSHLTTSPPLEQPGFLWQTSDGPVHVPSSAEEPCMSSRIWILHGVVCYWWFLFVSVVPTAFRSLTSSSCVVNGKWTAFI